MKGVVLWPKPDRHPLARATNTNEAALIIQRERKSTANQPQFALTKTPPFSEPSPRCHICLQMQFME